MKAWSVTRNGEPKDVLHLADVTAPTADGENILIRIDATGLNFLDAMMCRGDYPAPVPPPLIPGAEIVGHVLHPGQSRFAVGDRVVGVNPQGCGGLAEMISLPAHGAWPLPDDVPTPVGAALLVTYQTAYFALHRRARLMRGEVLLVHAGAGGVGTAAIQLGKAAGGRVIATARGPEKLKACRDEGADLALDYTQDDFVDAVLDHTGGAGADVICDQVGGEVFERSLTCLAFEGRIVPIGWASGTPPGVNLRDLVMRNQTVVGLSWGSAYPRLRPGVVAATHDHILELYRQGAIRPRLAPAVDFSRAADAINDLAQGRVIGKLVVMGGLVSSIG
jgi:NADPH2:quinone reductase